ncbi:hypothetical protein [Intrasporangium flavum]|uniref:hypothetical protein n=1 Tax=Intrasporangium flavum TaxID=1428657 RepID=UPI00096EF3EC|nr:hypothetical protein [Intrasporangium flavum]
MAVRRRTGTRITSIVVLVWLLIGVVAAFQRGYFGSSAPSCSRVASAAVTIVAGPLNYVGLDPRIGCTTPKPS